MHQDYLLALTAYEMQVKDELLDCYEQCKVEYLAEHNVGHIYPANTLLKEFYQQLDLTSSLNPEIGQTTKLKNWR